MRLTIIGAGNLGSAIAKGIVSKAIFTEICVTRRNIESLKYLKDKGIKVLSDNKEAARNSDVILLAVKPHQVKAIAEEIANEVGNALIISVITGVSLSELNSYFGSTKRIIRAMPNTAIAQSESLTCIAVNENVTEDDKQLSTTIFSSLG